MRRLAAFVLLTFVSFWSAQGQSTNATLTGRVSDAAKALVVDAKVAAVTDGTSVRYETTTNGSGEYHLANLPPGSYRIEVEKSGFKKLIKPEVILHVQDALEIDFEMLIGDVRSEEHTSELQSHSFISY